MDEISNTYHQTVRRRLVLLCLGLGLLGLSCGGGYADQNRSLVAELPELDGVELLEEDYYGYCTKDTCVFGNDGNGALLTYSVDVDLYTQQELVDAYAAELKDWDLFSKAGCLNAEPSFCEEIVSGNFTRGDHEISLNLDNWPAGRLEIHVDAHG